AAAQGGDGVFDDDIGGDHDDNRIGVALFDGVQRIDAGAVRQIDVEQDQVGLLGVKDGQPGGYRSRFDDAIAPTAQRFGQRIANHLLVVYNEHLVFRPSFSHSASLE